MINQRKTLYNRIVKFLSEKNNFKDIKELIHQESNKMFDRKTCILCRKNFAITLNLP